jgi:hypothetical protein
MGWFLLRCHLTDLIAFKFNGIRDSRMSFDKEMKTIRYSSLSMIESRGYQAAWCCRGFRYYSEHSN